MPSSLTTLHDVLKSWYTEPTTQAKATVEQSIEELMARARAQMRADELQRSDDMHRRRHWQVTLDRAGGATGTWVDANTGEVVAQTYVGGGGGGGLSLLCQTRGATTVTRLAAPQHDAHVRARAAQPLPVQSHCACGASFATVKRFECVDGGTESYCGDCWSAKPGGALPDRIAAAQPKAVDADPTQAWGAGATPSYEWEGT